MFPRNTAGHHEANGLRSTCTEDEKEIGYSTSIKKKRVPESKIPKPTDDEST